MSDKMREEFEEWYSSRFMGRKHMPERFLNRGEDGRYTHSASGADWESWQASRAALVVELPDAFKDAPHYSCYEGGWNDMRGETVDALTEAGVNVK